MKAFKPSHKLLMLIYATAILFFCHHFIFRPIILDWGAPERLRYLKLSGDAFTQGKSHTRAVLINATPEQIWPWLVQIGQERGGFYSYQWLENLFKADMKNVYEIRAEFQRPRFAGDTVWLANKDRYNGNGYQVVAEITPFRSLVMVGGEDFARITHGERAMGSWAFYLYPESATKTWLIARSSDGNTSFGNRLLRYFTFEVPHFVMERKMLVNMRKLTEGQRVAAVKDNGSTIRR